MRLFTVYLFTICYTKIVLCIIFEDFFAVGLSLYYQGDHLYEFFALLYGFYCCILLLRCLWSWHGCAVKSHGSVREFLESGHRVLCLTLKMLPDRKCSVWVKINIVVTPRSLLNLLFLDSYRFMFKISQYQYWLTCKSYHSSYLLTLICIII